MNSWKPASAWELENFSRTDTGSAIRSARQQRIASISGKRKASSMRTSKRARCNGHRSLSPSKRRFGERPSLQGEEWRAPTRQNYVVTTQCPLDHLAVGKTFVSGDTNSYIAGSTAESSFSDGFVRTCSPSTMTTQLSPDPSITYRQSPVRFEAALQHTARMGLSGREQGNQHPSKFSPAG
jgi:hypothetical protein